MTERDASGTPAGLGSLKQEYAAIRAPGHLARRIAARAGEAKPGRARFALPAAALGMALVLAAILPLMSGPDSPAGSARPPMPSLSTVLSGMPARPGTGIPALSSLGKLPRVAPPPPMPRRPGNRDTQSRIKPVVREISSADFSV